MLRSLLLLTLLLPARAKGQLPRLDEERVHVLPQRPVEDLLSGAPKERRLINFRGARLSYANDVFAQTDRYYTQGVEFQLWHPRLHRVDVLRLLSPIALRQISYSAAVIHDTYTPSTIRSDSILRGDRPYAALAAVRFEGYSTNGVTRRSTLSASVTLGVIGPPAGGREIQTAIHRATGDFIPLGWQHQIRTDALVNYGLEYQGVLLRRRRLDLRALASADAGTLDCKLGAGFLAMVSPLEGRRAKLRPSVSGELRGSAVGYNARLQGGVFNRQSPYVLPASDISRLVGSARVNLLVAFGRSGVGGEYTWLTREFTAGLSQAWGKLYVYHYLR